MEQINCKSHKNIIQMNKIIQFAYKATLLFSMLVSKNLNPQSHFEAEIRLRAAGRRNPPSFNSAISPSLGHNKRCSPFLPKKIDEPAEAACQLKKKIKFHRKTTNISHFNSKNREFPIKLLSKADASLCEIFYIMKNILIISKDNFAAGHSINNFYIDSSGKIITSIAPKKKKLARSGSWYPNMKTSRIFQSDLVKMMLELLIELTRPILDDFHKYFLRCSSQFQNNLSIATTLSMIKIYLECSKQKMPERISIQTLSKIEKQMDKANKGPIKRSNQKRAASQEQQLQLLSIGKVKHKKQNSLHFLNHKFIKNSPPAPVIAKISDTEASILATSKVESQHLNRSSNNNNYKILEQQFQHQQSQIKVNQALSSLEQQLENLFNTTKQEEQRKDPIKLKELASKIEVRDSYLFYESWQSGSSIPDELFQRNVLPIPHLGIQNNE